VTEPYETEREAAAAARHIHDTEPGTGARHGAPGTCGCWRTPAALRVSSSAPTTRILVWLTGWEPTTCAGVAGIIARAHASAEARERSTLPA
jgi:hypothetical protein